MKSKSKRNQRKPRPTKSKVDPYFTISYTNIRGLEKHLPEVKIHLQDAKPDFFSMCETGSAPHPVIPGYSPPEAKDDLQRKDLPKHIFSSLVSIYADDTTLYGSTSVSVSDQKLATDLSDDLEHVVQWGKTWLVSFNASKTKLVSFHHHQTDPGFHPVVMDASTLSESVHLDRLLGLKLTQDLKWNSYISSIASEASKMIGSLYRSRKYLTPSAILYLYKSQIRPRMEYCCHIWAGACKSSLSSLDRVQRRLRWLIGEELFNTLQPLSHRRDVASLSLFYRYFHGRCSEELHSLVPALQSFPVRTCFAVTAHWYHVDVLSSRTMFHAT